MNEIEVIVDIEDPPPEAASIGAFASGVLDELGVEGWQMGLLLTDDEGIREFNHRWRGLDRPTDVLSFVQDDGEEIPRVPGMPTEAGDVVVSLETVARNAETWSDPFDTELKRVVIHGILHLNGMDHPGDDYSTGMLKLQEDILARIAGPGKYDA